ncbi:hypothetical protein PUR28_16320 [Streptomyces sp. BE308]|uniref:hypothetical protein n=1 Tax=Streptomyces sp. BE308 TaxID=3002529 RepID=UPI002E7A858A|nr:hypothetical protein [Streptomyces sp. BE308]MEE1792314.1 hypothetical protein [Streptomyces sp. BE308]
MVLRSVVQDGGLLRVDDLWIDVIVGPPDHPYRVLDLDEYATAMTDGQLGPAEATDGLIRIQRFLDRRLNRRHEGERSWPDFPPAEVKAVLPIDLPRDWTLMES